MQGLMGPWAAASRDPATALMDGTSGLEARPRKPSSGRVLCLRHSGGEPALWAHAGGRVG